MSVRIRTKQIIFGKETVVSSYIPEGSATTKDKREKADRLDEELISITDRINKQFDEQKNKFGGNVFQKWKWLGVELAKATEYLLSNNLIDQPDIDNNAIWAGYGQYMRPELSRGYETKRSGSSKDHYRKCWLLATTPGTDWIGSWAGWDAFVDRGVQLVNSQKIMPILEQRLTNVILSKTDYQTLARNLVEELPSGAGAATISAMSDQDLERIIFSVCDRVLDSNSTYRPSEV